MLFTELRFGFLVLLQSNLLKPKTSLSRRGFEVNGPAESLKLLTTPSVKQLVYFGELSPSLKAKVRFRTCPFPYVCTPRCSLRALHLWMNGDSRMFWWCSSFVNTSASWLFLGWPGIRPAAIPLYGNYSPLCCMNWKSLNRKTWLRTFCGLVCQQVTEMR